MLSEKLHQALNDQIQREFASAYLYLSMAAYFERNNLPGMAHWMKKQFEEEQEHALKFYEYIFDRGGQVILQAIEAPPADFASPLEVFTKTLEHERKVTGHINDLYTQAVMDKDYASQVLLQWFISEQVEEEKTAAYIVSLLERIDGHAQGLIMLDHQLGER